MIIPQNKVREVQSKILSWYSINKRDLPWRKVRDPYAILVSELMSQQTQIIRVIPKYMSWMEALPTINDLAVAPVPQVLSLWSGLGYNRRALYLQKTAQVLVTQEGKWPTTVEELQKLPGVGKYTASAIACFAFNQQVIVIDTNVRKVIAHEFFNGELPEETVIESVAKQLLPQKRAYDWNQALMDYSSNVLKDKKIPVLKQSTFKGSNRYYRGMLLRKLLLKNQLSFFEVEILLSEGIKTFGNEWMSKFLKKLEKDGFIIIDASAIFLRNN